MTFVKDRKELRKIRSSGHVIKEVFSYLEERVSPGVTTAELDKEVEKLIKERGGIPAFKGYRGYPASICTSINNVVVHGIPSDSDILEEGDIISIDVGVKKNGYFTDAARTYPVGDISPEVKDLLDACRESLFAGIEEAVEGNRLSDISHAIESLVSKRGYKEVRSFVGHGIGKNLHESPEVPNWGEKGKGLLLKEGLVLAIEPMVNSGAREVKILDDGWTAVTCDGGWSSHYEHTVIVGRKNAEALT